MSKNKHTCPTCGGLVLFDVRPDGHSIEEAYKQFTDGLELEGRSPGYVKHLRSRHRDYIRPFLKGIDVRAIRTFHVKQFYHSLLKRGLATKTIKHILDALRACLNNAMELELLEKVPRFPLVKITAKEKAWISVEQQNAILARIPVHDRLLFRVLQQTGSRLSEAGAFKRKDLDDCGIWIRRAFGDGVGLKETKTGGHEFRPLLPGLYDELLEHGAVMLPEAFLFRTKDAHLYDRRNIYTLWKRAAAAAGFKISPYQAFRHSKASQKRAELEAEMRETLRNELGHASSGTTLKHYALPKERQVGK